MLADFLLLYIVVGNNSRFNLLHSQMHIFIHYNEVVENQPFHLPMQLFKFLFIYLFTIILTDYILTIPLLIQRGVRKSEHVFESFELFSSKCFSEDVCNLIICGTMSKMDCLGLYMMSNQMILCVDVFGSIMEYRILSQLDCRSIVDQQWSGVLLFFLQIFKYLPESYYFFCCFSYSHIFCFCC